MDIKYLLTLDKNMTLAELVVLNSIYEDQFMKISHYEDASLQPRSSVSRHLIKLKKKGWITKSVDRHDKRKIRVNISRLGVEIIKTALGGKFTFQ